MEEAKHTAPLPLPDALPDRSRKIIPLPLRAGSIPPATAGATEPESRSLWYALIFPQLADLTPARQQTHLNQLAALAHDFSSTVSLHPCALVLEIRSSLNYFGGLETIHRRLQEQVAGQLRQWELPEHFCYAASPTVSGSLLLARGGHNRLVYRRANLRSALGQLPARVLQLDKEPARRLHNMGVRYLRDLWRLPADGLRKRFGSAFLNQLHQALGKAPEPTRNYQPPPTFATAYELPYGVEDLSRLLPVADELLAQLCDFLQRRDLSTSRLQFALQHEQQQTTVITVGLRQPSREHRHLLLLLETRLAQLSIPAAVIGITLTVKKFDAFLGRNEMLFRSAGTQTLDDSPGLPPTPDACPRFMEFMEQLQARLGDHCLKSIHPMVEHCPEYAVDQRDYAASDGPDQPLKQVADNPRPLWLLPEPQPLVIHHGKLYHRRPLRILSGPERIETRWWSGTDVRRDYYLAEDSHGGRLWIYHEKTGEKRWFLHGLFA